jgi:AraC family transcriptional regulator
MSTNFGLEIPSTTSMATHGSSPAHRQLGWTYGQVVDRLDIEGATAFETIYERPTRVPGHEHEYPYITILLRGRYREPHRRGESYFVPFSAVFHPAHVRHSGIVDEMGCQFFTLEMDPAWMESIQTDLPEDSVFDWHAERILWPMLRLLHEYREGGAQSSVTMESLVLEIVSSVTSCGKNAALIPAHRWRLLLEKIHDSFRESIRVRDLARAAGIHPVHVARLFRRYTGLTPGEYLQQLRAQEACRLMHESERSLGEIASESGFADQSHMNRILKRLVHCSPGNFRLLI